MVVVNHTFKGYAAEIMYGKEDPAQAYGTAATVSNVFGRVTKFTPSAKNEFYKAWGVGEGRNLKDAAIGKYTLTGSVDYEVIDGSSLEYFFGSKTGTGPWNLVEADVLPSMTVECAMTSGEGDLIVGRYTGLFCKTLTLTATSGAKLTASMNWVAYDDDTNKATKEAIPTVSMNPYVFEQGNVTVGGNAIARVENFIITLENNVADDFGMGSRFTFKPQPGKREYTFTMKTKLFEKTSNSYLKDIFYGASGTPMTGVASSRPTAVAIVLDFTQDANRYLRLTLNNCWLENDDFNVDSPEACIGQTVSGFATSGSAVYKGTIV